MRRPPKLQVSSALLLAVKSSGVNSESCAVPHLWPNGASGRRSAGYPALGPREGVRRTRCPPPRREQKHTWLGILEKRPQETGLTSLWFLCPGTVFSLACHSAGTLVSLWRHLLSVCIFAAYVLHVSAVDGGRKGMSEGQCKQRGEQGGVPRPAAQRSHSGTEARALLVLRPFSGRSKSKAPRQSHSHAFAGGPNFGRGRTNCRMARCSGAEPRLHKGKGIPQLWQETAQVWEGSGRKARQGSCASQPGRETPLRESRVIPSENRPAFSAKERARSTPERLLKSSLGLLGLFPSRDYFHSLSEGALGALP